MGATGGRGPNDARCDRYFPQHDWKGTKKDGVRVASAPVQLCGVIPRQSIGCFDCGSWGDSDAETERSHRGSDGGGLIVGIAVEMSGKHLLP